MARSPKQPSFKKSGKAQVGSGHEGDYGKLENPTYVQNTDGYLRDGFTHRQVVTPCSLVNGRPGPGLAGGSFDRFYNGIRREQMHRRDHMNPTQDGQRDELPGAEKSQRSDDSFGYKQK